MQASGNGDKRRCAENLLAIVRGEVPYDRLRGLGIASVDGPADKSAEEIRQDALWVIETYEPRAQVENITVSNNDSVSGAFSVSANIE
jgi:phage baseplate assembly protein W